jgi:hypothetical protein
MKCNGGACRHALKKDEWSVTWSYAAHNFEGETRSRQALYGH